MAEAVRVTLIEIVTNPDVIALLRGARTPEPAAATIPAAVKPSFMQRVCSSAASVCKRALNGLKVAAKFTTSPVQTIVNGTIGTYRQVDKMWNLRKPILIAMGAGVIVGAVAYASAPWLAGAIAGCGAASTTLLGQFAVWARRLYASFSLG